MPLSPHARRRLSLLALPLPAVLAATVIVGSCSPSEPNALDKLGTVDLTLKGKLFRVWIADHEAEWERGLMFIKPEELAPLPDGTQRGMLFVYPYERRLNYWMKNTIVPLDIAYLTSDGVVLNSYTMTPLDERPFQYPSSGPARFALEINANVLSTLGVRGGDRIEIPDSVFKINP
jgi:hypothetical protein